MSKEGLESLFPMEDIAVMGMWELLPHLNKFRVSDETFDTLTHNFLTSMSPKLAEICKVLNFYMLGKVEGNH